MKQIADTFEEVTGANFKRNRVASEELIDQRNANLKAGNHFAALFATIQLAAFNWCLDCGARKESVYLRRSWFTRG